MEAKPVVVYVLTANPNGELADRTAKLFDGDPLFFVNVATVSDPKITNPDLEFYRVREVLTMAKREFPDQYVVLVKDTSISHADRDTIASFVSSAIDNQEKIKWDLCYLCKWLDRCDNQPFINETDTSSKIVQTFSPNGVQALMFAPSARDMILGLRPMRNGQPFVLQGNLSRTLNAAVTSGAMISVCAKPNIITFDPNLITNEADYLKLSECMLPKSNYYQQNMGLNSISNEKLVCGVIIFILLIIIIIFLIRRRA